MGDVIQPVAKHIQKPHVMPLYGVLVSDDVRSARRPPKQSPFLGNLIKELGYEARVESVTVLAP